MKKVTTLVITLMMVAQVILAQKKGEKDTNPFTIGVGGTFGKAKIIPSLEKLAIAQLTVSYKLTSEERVVGKEKSSGSMAGAKVTAYLKTTDADLTEEDLQEVTNYFYGYFQKSLKANGIDTVGWNQIAATEFYKKADGKVEEGGERAGNVWITKTANQGNIIYGGFTGFAFGKAKQAGRFCEEVGAPAAFFYVTVDFADVMVNVDIKTGTYSSLYTVTKTRNTKFQSSVAPAVKAVPATNTFSLFTNEKMGAETLYLNRDIDSALPYADNVSEDASKARSGLAKAFAFRKEMTPVVIETTRDKYKAAAKKALENYVNEFIAKVKSGK